MIDNSVEKKTVMSKSVTLNSPWTISFPAGWGAPESLRVESLKAWKDLNLSAEGKAFAGTATYTTEFNVDKVNPKLHYTLDLGKVEMIATVSLNGKELRTLWTTPYCLDLNDAIKTGKNILKVEVTSSWFNRLVYDAGQQESQRKTWNGTVKLTLSSPMKKEIRMRIPGWCKTYTLTVNGRKVKATTEKGYAVLQRNWKAGDEVTLDMK